MSKTVVIRINILCLWISEETSLDSIHVLGKKRSLEILESGKRKVTKERFPKTGLEYVCS